MPWDSEKMYTLQQLSFRWYPVCSRFMPSNSEKIPLKNENPPFGCPQKPACGKRQGYSVYFSTVFRLSKNIRWSHEELNIEFLIRERLFLITEVGSKEKKSSSKSSQFFFWSWSWSQSVRTASTLGLVPIGSAVEASKVRNLALFRIWIPQTSFWPISQPKMAQISLLGSRWNRVSFRYLTHVQKF